MSAHRQAERPETAGAPPAYEDSAFLRACRGLPNEATPVWLMRQAGRYMRQYRALREKVSFIELCRAPHLAAEVAVTALDEIGADAAILFSDILLILAPMGMELEYPESGGPVLRNPLRAAADVDRLSEARPRESLAFVFEAARETRAAMNPALPLIGFCGAPFTLASSMMCSGSGSARRVSPRVRFSTLPAIGSTRSLSPRPMEPASGQMSTGRPMQSEFLKKFLANVRAMTAPTPARLMPRGAVSRLEPQPKFLPPTITSPGFTLLGKSGSMPSMACAPSSSSGRLA